MKAKIKIGSPIFHDHAFLRWPDCQGQDNADPDTVFEVTEKRNYYDCRADGFGRTDMDDKSQKYGCGSIFVHRFDYLEILDEDEDATKN